MQETAKNAALEMNIPCRDDVASCSGGGQRLAASPQVVEDQPAKQEEDDYAGKEDPLVLARAPLDHADGVAADAQRVGDAVQPLLRVLEHLALVAQVAQDRLSPGNVVVERAVRVGEEVLLAQRVRLAHLVGRARRQGAAAVRVAPRLKGRVGRRRRGVGVGVLRRGVVRPPAQELCPVVLVLRVLPRLLQPVDLGAKVGQVLAEALDALKGLLLFLGDNLLPRQVVVLVEGRSRRASGRSCR